jgi:hypothetical protein
MTAQRVGAGAESQSGGRHQIRHAPPLTCDSDSVGDFLTKCLRVLLSLLPLHLNIYFLGCFFDACVRVCPLGWALSCQYIKALTYNTPGFSLTRQCFFRVALSCVACRPARTHTLPGAPSVDVNFAERVLEHQASSLTLSNATVAQVETGRVDCVLAQQQEPVRRRPQGLPPDMIQ